MGWSSITDHFKNAHYFHLGNNFLAVCQETDTLLAHFLLVIQDTRFMDKQEVCFIIN